MRYVRETHKYLTKSFWLLALVCLPAAFVLGFFSKPMASLTFIPKYSKTSIKGISDLFDLVFSRGSLEAIYPLFLIFIALLFSFSVGLSVIEKNFRVGRLIIKQPLKNLNETIVPVLTVLTICAVLVFLYTILLMSLTLALHYFLAGWGIPTTLTVVLVTFLSLVVFVLAMFLAGPMVFIMPMMLIYGYRFSDGLTHAFTLVGSRPLKIISGGLVPFIIVAVIEYILSFFNIFRPIEITIGIVLYLYIIMYIISYVMIVMFDVSGLERKDIKRY